MATYSLYKMTRGTPAFKKGQKVWRSIQRYIFNDYSGCVVFGRHRKSGKWVLSSIRPESQFKSKGKPNAKLIQYYVSIEGYLNDLFTLMLHNRIYKEKLTLRKIGYKSSAQDILIIRKEESIKSDNRFREEYSAKLEKELDNSKIESIKAIYEAINDKGRINIALGEVYDKMSVSELRRISWLKR